MWRGAVDDDRGHLAERSNQAVEPCTTLFTQSELGTNEIVKARFWPWLPRKSR